MELNLIHLTLNNFKNIENQEFDFVNKINCIVGLNGAGKTNILDAIFYLSFLKSYFNLTDPQLIKYGETFFSIKGIYNRLGTKEIITVAYQKNTKTVKRNEKRYKKLAQHIGLIPSVIITPDDIKLITGSGEERRRFLDIIISQADPKYLNALIQYRKIIQQRNTLLKNFAKKGTFDYSLIEIWDEQLIPLAQYINSQRNQFIKQFLPIFKNYYYQLADNQETVNIVYISQLNKEDYKLLLKQNIKKDLTLEYTFYGIHRDDLDFKIYGQPLKKFGSQGQQKTFLLALKFAQFDFIKNKLNIKPILLLDDIFDKLDPIRVEKLINLVANDNFGQIFITHTNRERLLQILSKINEPYKIFEINKGSVTNIIAN